MKKATRDRLYTIDRAIRTILGIATWVVLALLVAAAFDTPIKLILKYAFFVCGSIWVLLVLCRIVLSPFVKSDEEEDFEQKVDYILQKRAEQPQKDYTPLRSLTPEQEEAIKGVLSNLPSHRDKPSEINLAIVSRYLTALDQLGYADLSDRHYLRLWVQEVTGKKVPNSSQFNEAIPNTNRREVAKARDILSKAVADSENLSRIR